MTNSEAEAVRAEVTVMRQEFKTLQADMRELLDAWRLANGLLKAIRVMAAIAAGLAAFGSFITWATHFTQKGH